MKNIKMNLVMLGVGLMSVGALTSCGGGANKKYAEDAITAISRLSADFATVSGQIQAPYMISIPDEKDSTVRHEAVITWEFNENQWSTFSDEEENITYLTPNLPGENDAAIDFTITAVATVERSTARRAFEGTLLPTAVVPTQPVSEVYSGLTGATIVVQGIARNARTGNGYVVCDSTGCAYVYDTDNASNVVAGTTIRVSGSIGENNKTVNTLTVGCRQIVSVTDIAVVDGRKVYTIPQGSHIKDLTIAEYLAFVKDPADTNFVNHVGEVYKVKGYLTKYVAAYGTIWELVPTAGATSPYLGFYANTSNTTVSAGLSAFYEHLDTQYVEATIMMYDINQSQSSQNISWRCICLDIVATAEPTAA